MAGIKLQKRDDDFFVSYGHADLSRVEGLVNLLKHVCGLRIWFDGRDGNAATRSSELLAEAIGNARGALFCVSEGWKRSTWCKNEYDVALSEQRMHDGFEVVALRLDDVDAPPWFNTAEIVDLRTPDARAIGRLLRSLTSDVPRRYDNAEDVYLAAPWSRPSTLARDAFSLLRSTGWRLVGDSPNLKHLGEQRIASIIRTTRGVVALLPHDPSTTPHATSPFILEEAQVAVVCGKPLLLLAEPGVSVPPPLATASFGGAPVTVAPGRDGASMLATVLEAFDEHLQRQAHDDRGAFIFFATSLRDDAAQADDLTTVIERASNMACVRGERVSGEHVQRAIVDLIARAAVVIADVTDDHRNTLIEAGIAMGARTPLKLMVHAPGGEVPRRRFMFEGQEYHGYRTPEERLGLCYYFARQFRRRVYVVR